MVVKRKHLKSYFKCSRAKHRFWLCFENPAEAPGSFSVSVFYVSGSSRSFFDRAISWQRRVKILPKISEIIKSSTLNDLAHNTYSASMRSDSDLEYFCLFQMRFPLILIRFFQNQGCRC